MNAHKFVASKGIEEAKRVLEGAPTTATTIRPSLDFKNFLYGRCENASGSHILISELKKVVESVELVEQLGGIDSAKSRLKKAKESGSLLLSVRNKNGVSSVYDFKVEEAIKNWELANE